mgnify:CR=1 FL=1
MLIPMQLEVTGAVPSEFKIEDYVENCVKVSALVPLDATVGGIGRGAEVFNYKTAADIKEFEGLDLDNRTYTADAQVEMVKKGKNTKLILRSLKFKQPAQVKA